MFITFHQSVDFGVPLLKFALRPGEEDPSVFFVIKKGEWIFKYIFVEFYNFISQKHMSLKSCVMCVCHLLHVGLTGVAVVGVSRKVITERCPVTPPDQQLQDAQQFFTAQSARDLCFTYKVHKCGGL